MADPDPALFDLEGPIGPAPVSADLAALASRLHPSIRLGTSSWSFPGWRRIVYDDAHPTPRLARRGLNAYAAHPLLRCVAIDRTYYAPIAPAEFRAYAADVPEHFRFLVKAWQGLMRPLRDDGSRNPSFLDPVYAADQVIAPARAGLAHTLGPILFQFSPMDLGPAGGPTGLLDRLDRFLAALPPGPLYAVELRNHQLLRDPHLSLYRHILAARGVCHAYNGHPTMPPIDEQASLVPPDTQPALVCRWLLHAAHTYDGAKRRYEPFDRLVDEDPRTRNALAQLCLRGVALTLPVYVIANNKAEGSAPLTLVELARRIDRLSPARAPTGTTPA